MKIALWCDKSTKYRAGAIFDVFDILRTAVGGKKEKRMQTKGGLVQQREADASASEEEEGLLQHAWEKGGISGSMNIRLDVTKPRDDWRGASPASRTTACAMRLATALQDPTQLAALLSRMGSTAAAAQALDVLMGESGAAGDDASLPVLEDDDEEDVDEEDDAVVREEDEEEDDDENDHRVMDAEEEDDVEALADALKLVASVTAELQARVLFVTTQKKHETAMLSGRTHGVPMVSAPQVTSDACMNCAKSFSAFHRSRHCHSCGHSFCPKCSSQRQVLPKCFGYGTDAVRVCEKCSQWFHEALDGFFVAMSPPSRSPVDPAPVAVAPSIARRHSVSPVVHAAHSVLTPTPSASSPLTRSDVVPSSEDDMDAAEAEAADKRHLAALSSSAPVNSGSKRAWFSGHLRAMHVGDRLPRKNTRTDSDLSATDSTTERSLSRRTSKVNELTSPNPGDSSPLLLPSNMRSLSSAYQPEHEDKLQDAAEKLTTESEDEREDADDDVFEMDPEESAAPVESQPEAESADQQTDTNNEKPLHRKKSRKSKFSRSASFDFTNLHTPSNAATMTPVSSSNDLACAGTIGSSEDSSEASQLTSTPPDTPSMTGDRNSLRGKKKCFDDSDIVDARAKASDNATADVTLPATVLRFAVYKIGAKESQSLRRTLGFVKTNPVVDRYTLELDCSQGVVRCKSVFMHRFWSFHCDAVQQLTDGSVVGMASLVISQGGGQASHSLELKFANDEERDEFRQAVDKCRSTNKLQAMRVGSPPREVSVSAVGSSGSPISMNARKSISPLAGDGTESCPRDGEQSNGIDTNVSSPTLSADGSPDCCDDALVDPQWSLPCVKVQWLAGESPIKDTNVPAVLLIGPGGDTFDSSVVWGRIAGMLVVTNYRVVFMPLETACGNFRKSALGSIAYIPLFNITTTHVLYPNGRRPRSSRTYYTGLPSILSITCKDVRMMRVQLTGPLTHAEEKTVMLQALVTKLADVAQRYKPYEKDREIGQPFTLACTTPTDSSANNSFTSNRGAPQSNTSESDKHSGLEDIIAPTIITSYGPHSNSRAHTDSIGAGSPVLHPSASSMKLEMSGSFAFSYSIECPSPELDGWRLFAEEREFKRQIAGDLTVQPFLKYYLNARGNICKSYPSKLLLPSSMTSATLIKVADFRSKNRLPVITYYHRRNRCVLTRSSQPLLGNLLSGSSSLSDQLLLGVYRRLPDIIKNQNTASASSRPLYIFDARKIKASTGNRLMGKGGVETPQDYPGAVICHLNIANMYRMQSSFLSLMKLVMPGGTDDHDRTWWLSIESTRWLTHVRLVLDGAMKIARVLELEGSSVLVHCSDGWDRTAQLTALAQLMIDPYYRTIKGFAVLVEKDWCAFGHKFAERLGGDREKDPHRSKSSPVLMQFLDAVWQIQRQFSHAFEFNERFLLHVANSLTSSLYGTFLYDTRLERDLNDVATNTVSVWTPVLMNPAPYTNPDYVLWEKPVWPWTGYQMIRLWEGYFFQWHPKYFECHWLTSLLPYGSSASAVQPPPAETTAATASEESEKTTPLTDSTLAMLNAATGNPASQTTTATPSIALSTGGSSVASRSRSMGPEKLPMRNIFLFKS